MEKSKDFGAFMLLAGTLPFKTEQMESLQTANLDKLLIETDCPYLTSEPHRPSRNESAFIRRIAIFAEKMLDMAENDFCTLIDQNTQKFSISSESLSWTFYYLKSKNRHKRYHWLCSNPWEFYRCPPRIYVN
jgi:hypothetical protein